jgi:hypothetical protein
MDQHIARDDRTGSRQALLEQWFAEIVKGYPEQTARHIAAEGDAFHNPTGHTLRQHLADILDAVFAGNGAHLTPALREIVHLRAVQDFTAAQAVAFLLPLKAILRAEPEARTFDERIDRLMLLAFDLYVECRERVWEIRWNEQKRRSWLLDRREGVATRPDPESSSQVP